MARLLDVLQARKSLKRKTISVGCGIARGDIAYYQQGEGPELLLVVTSFALITTYMLTIQTLAKHYHVTAVELPGSGMSKTEAKAFTFEESAAWANAFVQGLSLQKPWVVGHSQSGAIAAIMLAQQPDLFAGAVLADPVGAHPSHNVWPILWGRILDGLYEPGLVLTGTHHVVFNLLRHFRHFLYQIWLCRGDKLVHSLFRAFSNPVLLLWGRHDHEMPLKGLQSWSNAIPHAKVYISEKGSHDFILTRPQEFTEAMVRFTSEAKT